MNKIDLIIFALESAINNIPGDDTEDYCIEALSAARELRDMKPVAWLLDFIDDGFEVIDHVVTNLEHIGAGHNVRPLYTLGDADE